MLQVAEASLLRNVSLNLEAFWQETDKRTGLYYKVCGKILLI